MTIDRRASYKLLIAGMLSSAAVMAVPAVAQTQEPAAGTGGDIVVTATKRSASTIQDTPISVQALPAEELVQKAALDFNGFFRSVAGLSAQDEGPGDKRYVIRGVNSNGAGTVGMYLDEVPITGENSQDGSGQAPDMKLFDMERVEVLKGPQGTTFGSGSMAGTIRYITAKPDLNAVKGNYQSSLRATKGASLGYQTDGAVSVPLIDGKLAVRASGYYANLPGWIDNQFQNGVNNEKSTAARGQIRWQATERLSVDLMAMFQKSHQDGKGYYNLLDYDKQAIGKSDYQALVARAPYDDKMQIYNATFSYDTGSGTATVAASRTVRDTNFQRDASLVAQAALKRPYNGSGRSVLIQPKHRRVDSLEARFASDFDGPLQILVGGYLSNEKRNFRSYWTTVGTNGWPEDAADATTLLDRHVNDTLKELALFGEVNYDLAEGLTVTVGGRYYDFDLKDTPYTVVKTGGAAGTGEGETFRSKDSGVIGRFNIDYKLSDNVNTYVQVAQGFRAGGVNDQTAAELANVTIPDGYGSDSLWSYEAGVKASLLDRKLFLNLAGYFIDWSDIQVSQSATNGTLSFPYTGNGGAAHIPGAEVTVDYRPIHGMQVTLSGNYTHARLSEDNPIVSTGAKGDRIPYSPDWSGNADVSYEFPLDALGVTARIGGNVSYQSATQTKLNASIANYHRLDGYAMVGLRAGIENGPWSLMLNATNLFDDGTVINYYQIGGQGVYPDGYYTNRPRTIILSGRVTF